MRRALAVAASLSALLACGENRTQPALPETAAISWSSPAADDGAVMVVVRGPGLGTAVPGSSPHRVYSRATGPDELRIIVVGDLEPGPLFTLQVEPGTPVSAFSATLEQVAARNDTLRPNLSGYTVTVGPASP
jgi:hypothetical protein